MLGSLPWGLKKKMGLVFRGGFPLAHPLAGKEKEIKPTKRYLIDKQKRRTNSNQLKNASVMQLVSKGDVNQTLQGDIERDNASGTWAPGVPS